MLVIISCSHIILYYSKLIRDILVFYLIVFSVKSEFVFCYATNSIWLLLHIHAHAYISQYSQLILSILNDFVLQFLIT